MKIPLVVPARLLAVALCAFVPSAFSAEPFSDDFEAHSVGPVNGQGMWTAPNGWEGGDAVLVEGVNSAFSQGGKALHFFRRDPHDLSTYVVLQLDASAADSPLVVTWDWMSGMYSAGASNPMFTLYDGPKAAVEFLIHHTTNRLRFYPRQDEPKDGDAFPEGATVFEPKTWYRFRLTADPQSAMFGLRVWKEGVEKPVVDISGLRFDSPVAGFTALRFSCNVPPEGVFSDGYYFDNVTVQAGDK